MPLVSVLLPVRNAEATLGEALASLQAQSLEDHEVVAVDDGSSDGSAALLVAAARRDPRVRVERATGRGLVAALNQARRSARGRFVARMDADDRSDPQRLATQAQRLTEDPATHVLGCRVRWFGTSPAPGMQAYVAWQNGLVDHDQITRDLFVESPLAHPSVMMRSSDLAALDGYREFEGPEDYDLWLRAHAAGLRFGKCEATLLDWRDGPGRLTRSDRRYAPGCFRALKIEALGRGLGAERAVVVWGAGPLGKAFARGWLASGRRLAAFAEVDRRKLGKRLHGAPVVSAGEAAETFPGALHVGAVGQPGARERLRAEARRLGLVDGRDFVAVA